METTNQNSTVPSPQTPPISPGVSDQQIKKLTQLASTLKPQTKLLIGVAAVLILVVVILFLFLPKRTIPIIVSPSVAPLSTVSASLTPRETSAFAKTEAFRQFDADLVNFQKDNNAVDLSETLLSFPLLDMQVNFDR